MSFVKFLPSADTDEESSASRLRICDIAAMAEAVSCYNAQSSSADFSKFARAQLSCETLTRLSVEQTESAWDHIVQLADMVSKMPASDLPEVTEKIRIWRLLAPETLFDEAAQIPDEALLCSIISDIERLCAGGGYPRNPSAL